jgi:protein-tyrosine phosphatase
MEPNPGNISRKRSLGYVQSYGGRNFRDIGGYETEDGKHCVRYGQIFRHGRLSELVSDEKVHLDNLGLKSVVDFRSDDEITFHAAYSPHGSQLHALKMQDPAMNQNKQAAMNQNKIKSHPLAFAFDRRILKAHFEANDFKAVSAYILAMPLVYRHLVTDKNRLATYAEFLRIVVNPENRPLSFMCNAGKDRTGLAALFVLTAVGVPEKTILEDYLMTNDTLDVEETVRTKIDKLSSAFPATKFAASDLELVANALSSVAGVSERNLDAALTAMKEKHGTVLQFMRQELGLTDNMINALRKGLLEPAPLVRARL